MAGKSLHTDERSHGNKDCGEDKPDEYGGEHSESIAVRARAAVVKIKNQPPLLHMPSYPPLSPLLTPVSTTKRPLEGDDSETPFVKRQLLFTQQSSEKTFQNYRPTLPGTQCQFGISEERMLHENRSTETNLTSNSSHWNPSQTLISPESGITYTPPPNAQSSPIVSCLQASSSGIGSFQGIEMEFVEYDTANSPITDEQEKSISLSNTSDSYKIQRMQKFLHRKFMYMKKELMPGEVASRLYNDNVIQGKDLEAVKDAEGRRHKCDVLIKAISHSLEAGNASVVQRIKDAFAKENYAYVFQDFEAYSEPAEIIGNGNGGSMQWKQKLSMFAAKMEDELDPRHFIDDLVSEEVLDLDEHQNISTVSFKPEKITCLIKYLQKKSQETFERFCKVIKKSYSSNSLVDALCSTQPLEGLQMEELKAPNVPLPVNIVRKEEQTFQMTLATTADIKFEFDGDAKDIEKMIVDENSPSPNDNLQEEAMDIGAFEVVETKFSSIRIVLSALSQRSEMQILKKCKLSPVFLMKLLQSLIKAEHLEKLKDRNIKRIFFEIRVQWPDNKISKEDIVRNLEFLETRITKEEIVRVLENVEGFEALLQEIVKMGTSKLCIKKFVDFLLNEESETLVDAFVKELKKNDRNEIIAKLAGHQTGNHACACTLEKEGLVEHYTLIGQEMADVEDIIKAFSEFPGFSKDVQDEFKEMLGISARETKLDCFLRKLLKLPDDGLQLCLLEERLHATGQVHLLEKITKQPSTMDDDIQITESEIRKNRIFLCDELEPKQYFNMFNDTEEVCDQLLSAPSREGRCEILLDFILKKCSSADKNSVLTQFSLQLYKRNPELLQYIKNSRRSNQKELRPLKENIISSYKHIVEEIEPLGFLKLFEERQELSTEEIESIRDLSTRRSRAIAFMNCVLKGSETKALCLLDALRFAGYVSLLKKLQESMKNYIECPRIYHALQDSNKCLLFKGELAIDFNAEHPAELQQSPKMPVFENWSIVTNWVLQNYFAIEGNETTSIQPNENVENHTEDMQYTSEQPVTNLTRGECRSVPLLESYKDLVGASSAIVTKQQITPRPDATSPLLSSRFTKLLQECQCNDQSKCFLNRRCGWRSATKSPSSNYGFIQTRYDEILDNNSASCSSPSPTTPRRVSLEEESNERIQDIPQGEEALKMFDEGYIC